MCCTVANIIFLRDFISEDRSKMIEAVYHLGLDSR